MTADAIQTIFNQYQTSVEMLAKRVLGEPYNFHRIQGFVQKEAIRPSHGIWQHIILECIDQYSRNASYSSATVAASINPEYIGEYYNYSLEHSEMDLPTAYAYFWMLTAGTLKHRLLRVLVIGYWMDTRHSKLSAWPTRCGAKNRLQQHR